MSRSAFFQQIPTNGGMLTALYQFHYRNVSRSVLGMISLFVIINALSSFQIYGMPIFDNMESKYTSRKKRPCPWWLRSLIRAMFGFGFFFVAVAIPFLGSLAGLIGGVALPVTLAYPCFMWLKIEETEDIQFNVVAQLGLGNPGDVAEHLADRGRGLRRDRHWH